MSKSDLVSIERLREGLEPGATVYTTVTHVSRSGMSRNIKVTFIKDNEPLHLSWSVAHALGWSMDKDRNTVKVSGCGMDMGFHLVYCLSYALFPDGFDCIGDRCPSNDHSNIHEAPEGIWHHHDGGYALRQRWL